MFLKWHGGQSESVHSLSPHTATSAKPLLSLSLSLSLSSLPPSLVVSSLACLITSPSPECHTHRTWRNPSSWSSRALSSGRRQSSKPPLLADESHDCSHGFWPFSVPSGHLFWNKLSVLYKIAPPLTDESSPFKSRLLFTSWFPRLFFDELRKFREVRPPKV